MIKSNIQLQGFLRETRQFNSRSNFANNMRLGVGYKLDELQIDATINSVDDIDLLIKRLEFLRPCFMNGFSGTPKQIDKL